MNYSECLLVPKKGIFSLEDNKFIENSILKRQRNGIENFVPDITSDDINKTANCRIESGYYAGLKVNHFGHFLLESLSRLSKLKASEHSTVIWISKGGSRTFTHWQKDIFKLLGIENYQHIIVNEPAIISNIEINAQEYVIWDIFTPYHQTFLGAYKIDKPMIERKVWLSREYASGGWVNEKSVQNLLAEQGWTIFYPEKHSIFEQLDMLLRSKVVAGIEGSAFHVLLFAKEVKQKIIIFSRIKNNTSNLHKVNNNYMLISDRKGFDQTEVSPLQYRVHGKKEKTESIICPSEILEYLV